MKRACLLLLLAVVPAGAPASAAEPAPPHAYLILPFENTADDASLAWLSPGLAQGLAEYFVGFGCRVMDSEERSVLLEGSGIPSGAPLALASALELGRKTSQRPGGLRTDRLILGRFNVNEGDIILAARVIDTTKEKARPWVQKSGRLRDILAVQRDLAVDLAKAEDIDPPPGRSEVVKRQAQDAPLLAFETYSRAMAEPDSKQRLVLLRKALQQYPGYPKAAYQAAVLLAREERWDESAAALDKASSDPFPYESDFHLLGSLVALKRKNVTAAVDEARRALAIADTARGHLLLGRALQASGDSAAALAELDKAKRGDPADAEIDELRRTLSEQPTPPERRTP